MKAFILARRIEPHVQSALLLALRLLYGWLLIQTGLGKFTNFQGTTSFFASLGLPAPAFMAALVASTEFGGGILLALGAGARFAGAALTGVMVTALATAHAAEAFESFSSLTEQPPFSYLLVVLVVIVFGAGRFSIDGWLRARAARPRTPTAQPDV